MQTPSKKPAVGSAQTVRSSTQVQRFIDAARELGCDQDEARFDAALKKVASASPPKSTPKPETKKPAKQAGFFMKGCAVRLPIIQIIARVMGVLVHYEGRPLGSNRSLTPQGGGACGDLNGHGH